MLESAELASVAIQILIGLFTLSSVAGAAIFAFRKRISAWWRPLSQIGATTERIEKRLDALGAHVSLIESSQRLALDANDQVATFETDADGRNVLVNSTYARWLGCDKADLLGWKFLNFIPHEDQDRVRDELALARKEVRPFRIRHKIQKLTGEVFEVEKNGSPLPDPGVPVKWIGTVRRIGADG